MKLLLLMLLTALGTSPATAALPSFQELRVGTVVYTNVTVLSYTATDLYFRHSQGVENVKLKYLDPNVQKLFEYDAKTAESIEQKREKEEAAVAQALATRATPAAETRRTDETGVTDPLTPASLLGKQTPELKGLQWLTAQPELGGKVRLVHLWEPWSAPCRNWLPTYSRLRANWGDRLLLVAVTVSPEAELKPYLERLGYAALDKDSGFATVVGATSIPHALLINAKGTVRYNGHPGGITEAFLQTVIGEE